MAEVNIPALFDHLGEQMVGLSTAIKNQGVSLDIRPYDGMIKDKTKLMKRTEKYFKLNNSIREDDIDFQTKKGDVIYYLDRLLNKEPMKLLNEEQMKMYQCRTSKVKKCDKNEHRRILIYDLKDTEYMYNFM